MNSMLNINYLETTLGTMVTVTTDKGICLLEFTDSKLLDLELRQLAICFKTKPLHGDHPHFETLSEQLDGYFKGERRNFDIPLDPVGTEFQLQVWLSLLKIPYGSTISYAKQAELLGRPSAVRAVANANGNNKISIILPCHRVIGSNGSLTGYGGGIWRKQKLLEMEQRYGKFD